MCVYIYIYMYIYDDMHTLRHVALICFNNHSSHKYFNAFSDGSFLHEHPASCTCRSCSSHGRWGTTSAEAFQGASQALLMAGWLGPWSINHGKNHRKRKENHRKWWFNGGLMGFYGIYPRLMTDIAMEHDH